jgi:cation:H+ antiporter
LGAKLRGNAVCRCDHFRPRSRGHGGRPAHRRGHLAIGNLFGSNLFNIAILAIDDLAYLPGPLLADVSLSHASSAFSAMMMSGLAVVGLVLRPPSRVFRTVSWISLLLLVIYLLNTLFLYLYGH